ncbi:MAG TPA: hypothetical protein VH008_07385 [Pseudonocardia sp.]|nr:hypothetical protein [Pseudonocardia sp.]
MLDEVDRVVQAPTRARRASNRRRLLAAALILAAVGILWISRARWTPLVFSTNPYEATPAENFPAGEAGIVLPPAAPVDGMTAEAVGAALDRVRQALIASYLDPRMLTGHNPDAVLSLLAPDSAAIVAPRFAAGGYGTTLVRLTPANRLAAPPRVSGQLTYQQVDWNGISALDVTSNYVFAYAFGEPAGVVVIHSETHWMFPLDTSLRPSSRGMYLGRTSGYWHGMDCAASAKGLTAPAPTIDRFADPTYHDPEPLDAYFDPNRPVGITSGCR